MTRPISMDLRERATTRLASGQSVRQVAAALGVAPSSVVKWSQRLRATGSCAPAKIGGRRPRKIVPDHKAWLLARIEAPCTLRGLVFELAARGLRVDYRTVWKAVHRAGWSSSTRPGPRLPWDQHGALARLGPQGRAPDRARAPRPLAHPIFSGTFIAALRVDRIEAPCILDGPVNGDAFRA